MGSARRLHAFRIGNRPPQHLQPAADAKHYDAVRRGAFDRRLQPALAQPEQIGKHAFASGQKDEVRRAQIPHALHIAHRDGFILFKGAEIRKIGNARQTNYGNVNRLLFSLPPKALRQTVLVVNFYGQPGDYARDGHAA